MARILRGEKGWGLFPKLELVSVAIGGFCGYHLGYMAAAYKEGSLRRKERKIDTIKKKASEALRDIHLYEQKKEVLVRSFREMLTYAKHLDQKQRGLMKLYEEVVERERKVKSAEEEEKNKKNMENIPKAKIE